MSTAIATGLDLTIYETPEAWSKALKARPTGELITDIDCYHRRFKRAVGEALGWAFKAGEFLIEAKRRCKHGEWESWVEKNMDFSVRTAQVYMHLFNHREEIKKKAKTQPVALLGIKDAMQLTAEPEPKQAEATGKIYQSDEPEPEAEIVEVYEGEPAPDGYDYLPVSEVEEAQVRATVAHVAHNSGNNEWYTPKEYVDAAKWVLGGIDLDPASCAVANKVIKAKKFYTAEDDGLKQPWAGRVWMNPPYASDKIGAFCEKLVNEIDEGNVTAAVVLVNNASETKWFQCLCYEADAVCFPSSRVKFWNPDKKVAQPLQGQAILSFGDGTIKFSEKFRHFGVVMHNERFVRSLIS